MARRNDLLNQQKVNAKAWNRVTNDLFIRVWDGIIEMKRNKNKINRKKIHYNTDL